MSDAHGSSAPPRKTPVYDRHVAAGGRIIDFGGWAMPVQYKSGILDEHKTVREAVGMFDVSHMGEVSVKGPRAAEAVQRIVTNDVGRLKDGDAFYTCSCREHGGIVDDLIVYRRAQDDFFLVVNASTSSKDFAHFVEHAGSMAEWKNLSDEYGLLSIQGPKAIALVTNHLTNGQIPPRGFTFADLPITGLTAGRRYFVSRTGYTGEDGVESMTPIDETAKLWDLVMEHGATYGLKPIGLGARDTLRLEARMCLYGNDIDEEHNPIEAGLGWAVKGKGYVGEGPIEQARAQGPRRKLVGFRVEDRAIARHGYPILAAGAAPGSAPVGVVTSGTTTPTVGAAIGLGYVPSELAAPGTRIAVDCRGKLAGAVIVKGPFYTKPAGK